MSYFSSNNSGFKAHAGFSVIYLCASAFALSAEPLPLSSSYWKDPAFQKSFNGSYRIEARIEPNVSTEERGLLVKIQEYMADGKRTVSLDTLKSSSLTAKSPALLFNLGNLHFEKGEHKEAIESYKKALDAYPSFRRAHRNLALALVSENDLENALKHLTEAVRLGDSEGTTYGMLGYCRLSQGEIASALQAYRLAQVTEPEVPEWKAGIAQCLQNMGDDREAITLLDEIIRQRPLEPSYAVLQSNLYLGVDKPDAAAKALEMPFRLNLLSPDETLQLAGLHLRAGLSEVAKDRIETAYSGEEKPGTDAVLRLVETASADSDWPMVKDLLEKAETENPPRSLKLAKARYLIGSEESPADGEKILEALIDEDPTDGTTLLILAKYRMQVGQNGSAELLLERAVTDVSTAYEANVELARLMVAAQRYDSALEAVDAALELKKSEQLTRYREALANTLSASK
ncbi:tetratricopeptide repeat protein [Luteolibacter sp. AS25]|uniref:tetratricopeptide repeat protein n=1 Tax=Luteolibacter sp. AS25 TaxID=3135776 RepID=UPI00398B55A4